MATNNRQGNNKIQPDQTAGAKRKRSGLAVSYLFLVRWLLFIAIRFVLFVCLLFVVSCLLSLFVVLFCFVVCWLFVCCLFVCLLIVVLFVLLCFVCFCLLVCLLFCFVWKSFSSEGGRGAWGWKWKSRKRPRAGVSKGGIDKNQTHTIFITRIRQYRRFKNF